MTAAKRRQRSSLYQGRALSFRSGRFFLFLHRSPPFAHVRNLEEAAVKCCKLQREIKAPPFSRRDQLPTRGNKEPSERSRPRIFGMHSVYTDEVLLLPPLFSARILELHSAGPQNIAASKRRITPHGVFRRIKKVPQARGSLSLIASDTNKLDFLWTR